MLLLVLERLYGFPFKDKLTHSFTLHITFIHLTLHAHTKYSTQTTHTNSRLCTLQ